jgi:hypothetical protein
MQQRKQEERVGGIFEFSYGMLRCDEILVMFGRLLLGKKFEVNIARLE